MPPIFTISLAPSVTPVTVITTRVSLALSTSLIGLDGNRATALAPLSAPSCSVKVTAWSNTPLPAVPSRSTTGASSVPWMVTVSVLV